MVQALRSVHWASANKSSLATIFANPIYRGVKVFNRETRVEGEHGRKRRRNPQQDVVTSEVEAIVPEQLWSRVQELHARRWQIDSRSGATPVGTSSPSCSAARAAAGWRARIRGSGGTTAA
jgi:hypothetical protein